MSFPVMKRKLIFIEFTVGFLSLLIGVVTGMSLIGKPLRLVDVILILALGVAAGAAITQAIIHFCHHRRQGARPDDVRRDA